MYVTITLCLQCKADEDDLYMNEVVKNEKPTTTPEATSLPPKKEPESKRECLRNVSDLIAREAPSAQKQQAPRQSATLFEQFPYEGDFSDVLVAVLQVSNLQWFVFWTVFMTMVGG